MTDLKRRTWSGLVAAVAGLAIATPALAEDTKSRATDQTQDPAASTRESTQTAGRQGRTPSAQPGTMNQRQQQGDASTSTGRLLDVEELNDNAASYVGQKVSVAGEIQEKLDPRSFVIESGGIFDDEITVVVPRDAKGISANDLVEDADVVVTGTVRSSTLIEIERELGWDLQPELEVEFDGTRTYLIAEQIRRQKD